MNKSEVKQLRAALEANGWRLGEYCRGAETTITRVKAELAESAEGRALLEELAKNKPKRGASGKHANNTLKISGVTDEQRDELYAFAESRGGFSPWAKRLLLTAISKS